jgi:hypothetical protein
MMKKNIESIKKDLKQGVLFLIGYFSILVTPNMKEYDILARFGRRYAKYSDAEKKNILAEVVSVIERFI